MATIIFSSVVAHLPWPGMPSTAEGFYGLIFVIAAVVWIAVRGTVSLGNSLTYHVARPFLYTSLIFFVIIVAANR